MGHGGVGLFGFIAPAQFALARQGASHSKLFAIGRLVDHEYLAVLWRKRNVDMPAVETINTAAQAALGTPLTNKHSWAT